MNDSMNITLQTSTIYMNYLPSDCSGASSFSVLRILEGELGQLGPSISDGSQSKNSQGRSLVRQGIEQVNVRHVLLPVIMVSMQGNMSPGRNADAISRSILSFSTWASSALDDPYIMETRTICSQSLHIKTDSAETTGMECMTP